MTSHKRALRALATVAAACGAAAVAAGSATANPPIVTAPTGADVHRAWQGYVACMNDQPGLRVTLMPPPRYGVMIAPTGGAASLRTAAARAAFEARAHAANAVCRRFLAPIQKGSRSAQTEAAFRDRALAFARCMRRHGVSIGDPMIKKVVGGFDVSWPPSPGVAVGGRRWQRAATACRSLNPITGG
jgi:hypothetical protein